MRKGMRTRMSYRCTLLSVLCALILAAPVAAETVLVYLAPADATAPATEVSSGVDRALEAGAMERLFDDGHIVFDAGGRQEPGAGIPKHLPRSLLLARNGGADFVLVVGVAYAHDEDGAISIREARYRFTQVDGSVPIRNGVVYPGDVLGEQELSEEEVSMAVGRAIVAELGDSW
jgi:hypothetical protein